MEHKFTKVLIINKRWFKDMDFCMMFHPYLENVLKLTILSDLNVMIVTYKGHVTALYQLHPGKEQMLWMQLSWLTQTSPYIIPDRAQSLFEMRPPNKEEVDELCIKKVTNCFKSTALSIGIIIYLSLKSLEFQI
ncbi:hypothetical protein P5673_025603 [Acropora cervicornis]|uniref:Uncharacterized protein n=1 Tax=Acropora cervicornis TaxID=6130 RepID=A0AAD9Q2G6_ACRCE|nr:hypothetical protein P5673_025603 [Acropora cervicornis]